MNKYLAKKLQFTDNAAKIVALEFISGSLNADYQSQFIDQFLCREPQEICRILEWKQEKFVYKLIENAIKERSFHSLMYQQNRSGFLCEARFSKCSWMNYDENGKFEDDGSHMASCSHWHTKYIYAHSIGELVDKIIEQSVKFFQIDIANDTIGKERAKQNHKREKEARKKEVKIAPSEDKVKESNLKFNVSFNDKTAKKESTNPINDMT